MRTKRIFNWLLRDAKIDTEYGNITHFEWCEKEAQRIGGCEIKEKKIHGEDCCSLYRKI